MTHSSSSSVLSCCCHATRYAWWICKYYKISKINTYASKGPPFVFSFPLTTNLSLPFILTYLKMEHMLQMDFILSWHRNKSRIIYNQNFYTFVSIRIKWAVLVISYQNKLAHVLDKNTWQQKQWEINFLPWLLRFASVIRVWLPGWGNLEDNDKYDLIV